MNTFETIDPRNYTIERFVASTPIEWELTSSSFGCVVTDPSNLEGAVTIERASNNTATPIAGTNTPVNPSGVYEKVLYQSIKTLFYDDSIYPTAGLAPLTDNSYVVSVGQQFYGSRIVPQSFTLQLNTIATPVYDDGNANLLVGSELVGRIFYEKGIAVIKENVASGVASVSTSGIKIVNNTTISVSYNSDIEIFRHQIDVKILPGSFNAAILNPSMQRGFTTSGTEYKFVADGIQSSFDIVEPYDINSFLSGSAIVSVGGLVFNPISDYTINASNLDFVIAPPSGAVVLVRAFVNATTASIDDFVSLTKQLGIDPIAENKWSLYRLMGRDQIKPYITTIGLYDDSNQLLAIAKTSTPIQRTFETSQIFMIRFDVGFPEGK